MPQASLNSVLAAVRRSGFSHGVVRVDGVHLEFGRPSAGTGPAGLPAAAIPETAAPAVAAPAVNGTATPVRAAAPGIVSLVVLVGSVIGDGEVVGHIQVHRKRVPIVATDGGRIDEIAAGDGSFVAYGDPVCSISTRA